MFERIPSYEEREKMKQEGWDQFYKSETPHGKAAGLLRVCDGHYWRVREALENRKNKKSLLKKWQKKKYTPGYELDIDHYTPHWMHSMRQHIPEDIMKVLDENWGYKPLKSEHLPDGHTMYLEEAKDLS